MRSNQMKGQVLNLPAQTVEKIRAGFKPATPSLRAQRSNPARSLTLQKPFWIATALRASQ
jgi:hypothetical protein